VVPRRKNSQLSKTLKTPPVRKCPRTKIRVPKYPFFKTPSNPDPAEGIAPHPERQTSGCFQNTMKDMRARKAAQPPGDPFYKKHHERLYGHLAGGNGQEIMKLRGSVEN